MSIRRVAFLLWLCAAGAGPLHAAARLADPAALGLAQLGGADFLPQRQAMYEDLYEDPDSVAVQIDLARLHLSQMMLPEAESFLSPLDPATLPADQAAEVLGMRAMLDLLSGGSRAELGLAHTQGWSGGVALRAAVYSDIGAMDAAAEALPLAAQSLDLLSPAIRAAVLPALLKAAIDTENWDLAHGFASRFEAHPELRESSVYWLQLGRAAAAKGDPLTAFEGYVKAVRGRDGAAQEARLALVNLGLETETLTEDEAIALLEAARWAWRGDEVATRGLLRLAELYVRRTDPVAALGALGQVLTDDPSEGAKASARQAADAVLESFYDAGAAGKIPLSAFLEGHRRIVPRFRFEPGFVAQAVKLPDTFLAAGITTVAADEYRALRDLLTLARELDLYPVEGDRGDLLRLKEARAYLDGDRAAEAAALLQPMVQAGGLHRDDAEAMLAEAVTRGGENGDLSVLDASRETAQTRRLRASALYEDEQWRAARTAYLGLWDTAPDSFEFVDAVRLILAAHRSGDAPTVKRVAAAFHDLTNLPVWTEIAGALTERAPEEGPLTHADTRRRIDEAMRAMDATDLVEAPEAAESQ